MKPSAVLSGGIVLLAALACTLGTAAPTSTPDLVATITAQAEALDALAPSSSPLGGTASAAGSPTGAPTTSAGNPAPQQPSVATATKRPKPTKTAFTLTSTAVPTLSIPRTPGNLLVGSTSCGKGTSAQGDAIWKAVVTLTWEDSDTETAYRLYRNGTAYTTVVLQDATTWPISIEYAIGPNNSAEYDYFELEAYNSTGASPKASVYAYRCHY